MKNSRQAQWHVNRYHKAAIVLSILALLLSFILSLYRFTTVGSHFDVTVTITSSRLLSEDRSRVDFRYVLRKDESIIFDVLDAVDLFALAVPVAGGSSHRVTFEKQFFMPDAVAFGTYTFHVYANHLGEERRVTSFDLFVFPRFIAVFFSYSFLILLLFISLVCVFAGMQKERDNSFFRKHLSRFFPVRSKS